MFLYIDPRAFELQLSLQNLMGIARGVATLKTPLRLTGRAYDTQVRVSGVYSPEAGSLGLVLNDEPSQNQIARISIPDVNQTYYLVELLPDLKFAGCRKERAKTPTGALLSTRAVGSPESQVTKAKLAWAAGWRPQLQGLNAIFQRYVAPDGAPVV